MFFFALYAPIRFAFDFLRSDDLRYAGLTPAQWSAIPMLLTALTLFLMHHKKIMPNLVL